MASIKADGEESKISETIWACFWRAGQGQSKCDKRVRYRGDVLSADVWADVPNPEGIGKNPVII